MNVRPIEMMMPESTRCKVQNPMMSRALSPAIPRMGNAQNGCTILVQLSPQATAMAARAASESRRAIEALADAPRFRLVETRALGGDVFHRWVRDLV